MASAPCTWLSVGRSKEGVGVTGVKPARLITFHSGISILGINSWVDRLAMAACSLDGETEESDELQDPAKLTAVLHSRSDPSSVLRM